MGRLDRAWEQNLDILAAHKLPVIKAHGGLSDYTTGRGPGGRRWKSGFWSTRRAAAAANNGT
jgi:hypothetical protein